MINNEHYILAPILGITNRIFRNALAKTFGGVDEALAPFISAKQNTSVPKSYLDDLDPRKNLIKSTPQILTNDAKLFCQYAAELKDYGHQKINLNIGCPHRMTVTKNKGAGLLSSPIILKKLLQDISSISDIEISIKIRLGMTNTNEIFEIIPIINDLDIKDITIHPRTADQMYSGKIHLDTFEKCIEKLKYPPCYSGDIFSIEDFKALKNKFPTISRWMIGRGALINPNLFKEIKQRSLLELTPTKLKELITTYGEDYLSKKNGESDFLHRMKELWEYLAQSKLLSDKSIKKIKKSKNINAYWEAVHLIFGE